MTYSMNREKRHSPTSVIGPSRHVRLRRPENSTLGCVPRGNHAVHDATRTDFLIRSIHYCAVHFRTLFSFVVEIFSIRFLGFGVCSPRYLITRARFFQRPGNSESSTRRHRRLRTPLDKRRRVDPDFLEKFVNCSFELFLTVILRFSIFSWFGEY